MPHSNVARGTQYENFVHGIYQALLTADGVDNIDVRHNITMRGNSGCDHQIDVYWEFQLAGQRYKTAIECKSFDKPINVGRVRDFYGVLVDVPGLIGVFATEVGYQRGAKLFADHYGIALKEIRVPADADWEGRVRKIHLRAHMVMPTIFSFDLRPTQAFRATLKPGEEQTLELNFSSHDPIIFDTAGNAVSSYENIRGSLPHQMKSETGLRHFAPFPNHVFRTSTVEMEIDGVDIGYDVVVDIEESTIDGDELAKAIIKDVASGALTFVDKNGSIKQPRPV